MVNVLVSRSKGPRSSVTGVSPIAFVATALAIPLVSQVPVVQWVDNLQYPLDSTVCFVNTYPLDNGETVVFL